jgi:hypothetical protein
MQQWLWLWCGSRDGYTAEEFHRRCDGHANTLTLIEDTDGNVFGGFTPVEWESRVWTGTSKDMVKGDDSLRSFLFTLRNPHGVPPRKFALKEEMKGSAIYCNSHCCADSAECDIHVSDNCNNTQTMISACRYSRNSSCTRIGTLYEGDTAYANDTQFKFVFTGHEEFKVKEIEVFEIKD